jgi:hypothetical protein
MTSVQERAVVVFVGFTLLAVSRTFAGPVNGRVMNAAGDAVANASVRLTSHGIDVTAKSDKTGQYKFAKVRSGTYWVTVTSPGFKRVSKGVTIGASPTTTNFVLMLDATDYSTTATGDAPVIMDMEATPDAPAPPFPLRSWVDQSDAVLHLILGKGTGRVQETGLGRVVCTDYSAKVVEVLKAQVPVGPIGSSVDFLQPYVGTVTINGRTSTASRDPYSQGTEAIAFLKWDKTASRLMLTARPLIVVRDGHVYADSAVAPADYPDGAALDNLLSAVRTLMRTPR